VGVLYLEQLVGRVKGEEGSNLSAIIGIGSLYSVCKRRCWCPAGLLSGQGSVGAVGWGTH